jgi:hypothetical protein
MTTRRRLLARAMSFRPDAAIANGDHIYWDMTTAMIRSEPTYVSTGDGRARQLPRASCSWTPAATAPRARCGAEILQP